jgi:mono/diheme cytochrome c family protein
MRRLALALCIALAAGCGSGDDAKPAAPASPAPAATPAPAPPPAPAAPAPAPGADPVAAANEVFATRCALCHGPDGRGDGPGSAALNPKPRNYHDEAWQASVTDDQIRKTILEGGAAVGKSPVMPAHPDLASNTQVLAALIAKIRGLGKN